VQGGSGVAKPPQLDDARHTRTPSPTVHLWYRLRVCSVRHTAVATLCGLGHLPHEQATRGRCGRPSRDSQRPTRTSQAKRAVSRTYPVRQAFQDAQATLRPNGAEGGGLGDGRGETPQSPSPNLAQGGNDATAAATQAHWWCERGQKACVHSVAGPYTRTHTHTHTHAHTHTTPHGLTMAQSCSKMG
jgi:hypothetical protein